MGSKLSTLGWVGCIGAASLGALVAAGTMAVVVWGAVNVSALGATPTPVPGTSSPTESVAQATHARLVRFDFAPEISDADRAVLIAAADADAAHVQATFGRSFSPAPVVHVLASESALADGLAERCGVLPARAREMARLYSGYTGRDIATGAYTVMLDWHRIGPERPVYRLRHELTHVMTHQILPDPRDTPVWFEEGLAELEAHTIPGLSWTRLQSRYFAASMAMTGTLTPLDKLATYEETLASLSVQLANATESLRLLEDDVTPARVVRVLDESAQGKPFREAFQAATGVSFARFAAGTPGRLRALADTFPGVAAVSDDPSGPGATYVLYGFKPRSKVTVRIRGNGLDGSSQYTVGEQGYLSQYFVAGWPPGDYVVEVTGDHESAQANVKKLAKP